MKITDIGEHLPLSTRRVVIACGEVCRYGTELGLVEGLADGKILVRDGAHLERTHYELTPEAARAAAKALMHAAFGVEQWERRARGYYRVRARVAEGQVFVTYHDTELLMRLSKLRRARRCIVCEKLVGALYVVRREPVQHTADGRAIWRERPAHAAEVCEPCVERLANAPTEIAEVAPMREEASP